MVYGHCWSFVNDEKIVFAGYIPSPAQEWAVIYWPYAHATYLAHPVYENEALGSKKQQWRLTPAVWHEDLSCLPIISGETLNDSA